MPNTIQLRRSAVQGAAPTTAQLALGELAINTYDGKLYLKKNVSGTESIVEIGGGGASGTTISATAPSSPSVGTLWWDSTTGSLKIYYNDGNTSQWVDASSNSYNSAGAMVYPSAGIAVSNGSAWSTSLTAPTGTIVGTTDTQILSNKTITNLVFDGDYTEEVFTITDGASVDLDPSNGTVQLWTLGATRTPTANSFSSGQSLTLMIDDGAAYAINWPSVTWKTGGGTAPTLNTTGYTVIQLWKVSTVLYGARVGDA